MGLVDLGDETYVSLTTFKRDGTPVLTPVWVARDDGRLLIRSAANAGRSSASDAISTCGSRAAALTGKSTARPSTGRQRSLRTRPRSRRSRQRKYGLVYRLITGLKALNRWLRRKPDVESVTIAIVPTPR